MSQTLVCVCSEMHMRSVFFRCKQCTHDACVDRSYVGTLFMVDSTFFFFQVIEEVLKKYEICWEDLLRLPSHPKIVPQNSGAFLHEI